MVKIFADTASISEIRTFMDCGTCDGVTTNQKIFLTEGGVDFRRRVIDICDMVRAPVSVETTSNNTNALLEEARMYASWHPNVVVKAAMYGNGDGLRVVRQLSKEGIKTNMTCMVSFTQMLLACKAGATYASLFFNRSRDAGEDPVGIIRDISQLIRAHDFKTEIIVGSIRKPSDVREAAVAGADIVTIPHKVFVQLPFHQKTEDTIAEFDEAWKKFQQLQPQNRPPKAV